MQNNTQENSFFDPIDDIDMNTIKIDEFHKRCHAFIVQVAHSTGLSLPECELVDNDILIKIFVHHNFGNFNASLGSLKPYLAATARNLARNYLRKQNRYDYQDPEKMTELADSFVENGMEVASPTPDEVLQEYEEKKAMLTKAIGMLRVHDPLHIQAITMNVIEGKKAADIAAALNMDIQDVSRICCRGRKNIQKILLELQKQQNAQE